MTKKQKQQLADLEQELALLKSWRLTGEVLPDVPAEDRDSVRWMIYGSVLNEHPCPSEMPNSTVHWMKSPAGFSTPKLALQAHRHEAEQAMMRLLARIDRQIEECGERDKSKAGTMERRWK